MSFYFSVLCQGNSLAWTKGREKVFEGSKIREFMKTLSRQEKCLYWVKAKIQNILDNTYYEMQDIDLNNKIDILIGLSLLRLTWHC